MKIQALKHKFDNQELHMHHWTPSKKSKAVLQIAHGMAEHSRRYHDLGSFMSSREIAVYAHDHRGHGQTAGNTSQLGFCGAQNGWQKVLKDIHCLTKYIQKKHPGIPVFLLGHSFGSLLSLNYAFHWANDIQGIILSGLSSYQPVLSYSGLIIAFLESKIKGKKAKSHILNNMLFGGYNKHFQPARTDFDWLCTNPEVVDRYEEDPYCGAVSSAGFYYDLAKATININRFSHLKKIPSWTPMLIISGEYDPVGGMTKGTYKIFQRLKKAGLKDVRFKVYDGCRHEVLNEKSKAQTFQDILEWTLARV